jgi:type I restriction enzyme S subunit
MGKAQRAHHRVNGGGAGVMGGKYQAYSEYKESGVEWLRQVPTEWTVIGIKHLSKVMRGASPRPIDAPKYFDYEGEYAWVRIADVTASDTHLELTTQQLSSLGANLSVKLEPGELFLSIAGSVGKPCITAIKSCIHDGFVYFPELKLNPKYLFYLFAAGEAYKGLGKMGTQLNLNTETVGNIKLGLPSKSEVKKIVTFLDYETARIDRLIEKQQRLIELLKEKRQAVISHAVTKGLDPNVPMKDSGVEWMGYFSI